MKKRKELTQQEKLDILLDEINECIQRAVIMLGMDLSEKEFIFYDGQIKVLNRTLKSIEDEN